MTRFPTSPAPSKRTFFLAAALGIITLTVFSPLFHAQFLNWDDPQNLFQNPLILQRDPPALAYFWNHPSGDLYVPVTETAWWTISGSAQTGGDPPLNPHVFHAANVFCHAASVLVVFAIVRMLVGNEWAAAVGALLFAVHPLQAESVGWASGLKDLLAGLFGFLSLWLYLLNLRAGKQWRSLRWLAATLLLALALLSKASAVTIPVIAAIITILVLRRRVAAAVLELSPWFFMAGAAALLAHFVQPAAGMAKAVPLWARPFIAADSLAFYVAKLFFPAHLVMDYARSPDRLLHQYPYLAYWTWTLPAAVAICIWLARRRFPHVAAGALVFLAGLFPMLGLVAFEFQVYSTVADHYVYIAMLGTALAAAALVSRLDRPIFSVVTPVLAGLTLAVLCYFQSRIWLTDQALFDRLLEADPHNWLALNHRWYRSMLRGDLSQARIDALAFIKLCPENYNGYLDLAKVLHSQGRLDEAIPYYRRTMEINPHIEVAYTGLASLYAQDAASTWRFRSIGKPWS